MQAIIEHCQENGISIAYGNIKNTFAEKIEAFYGNDFRLVVNGMTFYYKDSEERFYNFLDHLVDLKKAEIKNGDYIMPFGKHKGRAIKNVPFEYLTYLCDKYPKTDKRIVKFVDSELAKGKT